MFLTRVQQTVSRSAPHSVLQHINWTLFWCSLRGYHWGQNYSIPFFRFGELFSKLLQDTLKHIISGGVDFCNVMIGAVLPWKELIFRLQLQFFSPCYVTINYRNVTPFLYRILSFQNIICNIFVPNGKPCLALANCVWRHSSAIFSSHHLLDTV